MRTIHKHLLQIVSKQTIDLHKGSIILKVELQNNSPMIWVETETDNEIVNAKIRIYMTGEEISSHLQLTYIGTLFTEQHVLHVYLDQTISLPPLNLD